VGLFRDCPIVFDYPLLSQELVKLQTSNIAGTFIGPTGTKAEQKPCKNFGKGSVAHTEGLKNFPCTDI